MTREEAIANLKMIMLAYIEPPPTKEQIKIINDTFDMAIEALQVYPDTKDKPLKKYTVYATSEAEVTTDSEDELEIFNEAYDFLIANMDYKIVREVENDKRRSN